MAKTYTKRALSFVVPEDAYLGLLEEVWPEAAAQTFEAGWPLALSGGRAAEFVDPTTAGLLGFACEDASGTTDNRLKIIKALGALVSVEGNLLTGSAADNVLAVTDWGLEVDIQKNANLLGTGLAGWYLDDTAADAAAIVESEKTSDVLPDAAKGYAEVGDTNARVRARIKGSATIWAP